MRKAWKLLAIVLAALWGIGNLFPLSSQYAIATQPPIDIVDARLLTLAADPSGSLWAAWEADTGTDAEILYSRQIEGEWQPPALVAGRPEAWDRAPSLVVAADGSPWLAWSSVQNSDIDHSDILVTRWDGNGWTAPEVVPLGQAGRDACPGCGWATEPVLAAAPDGTLWLAWVGFDGTDDEIFAQSWDGKAWSSPLQVSADDDDPDLYDRQPRLAVGAAGHPWLVWTGLDTGPDDEIYGSRWTGSAWTPEEMISTGDGLLDTRPALAVDAEGQPWVLWKARILDEVDTGGQMPGDDEDFGRLRILASHWDAARSAWTEESLASSSLALAVDESYPALALDARGRVRATWLAANGTDTSFAHALWRDGAWTEPRRVAAGVPYEQAALVTTGDGGPALFWLDLSAVGPVPLGWAALDDAAEPLSSFFVDVAPLEGALSVSPYPNRHLAAGDSITKGKVGQIPYPAILEDMLDASIGQSKVINKGLPGKKIEGVKARLNTFVNEDRPKYVYFMAGMNDATDLRTGDDVEDELFTVVRIIQKEVIVTDVELMFDTVTPRLDDRNSYVQSINTMIKSVANRKAVPYCDQYNAFVNDPAPLTDLVSGDQIHPTQAGQQLIAEKTASCLEAHFPGFEFDDEDPVAWIDYLADPAECGQVEVSWDGYDVLNGSHYPARVKDYDVQAKEEGGVWTDWLVNTTSKSGIYPGGEHNKTVQFQVRARDVAGNQGDWSAPEQTDVQDGLPPYLVTVATLPPAQTAPFTVRWSAWDACTDIATYDVQYRVGGGAEQSWHDATPDSSDDFTPGTPQYGETYSFQARARDVVGNESGWSSPSGTVLARFSLSGNIYTTRHEPIVAMSDIQVAPAPLYLRKQFENYEAFGVDVGDYDLTASASRSAGLPPLKLTGVTSDVSGLDFHLPAADDAVVDGGFEGDLSLWRLEGTDPPTATMEAHTGDGAVKLGSPGEQSYLTQVVSPAAQMSAPTFSFLVRLDQAGPDSALQVTLEDGGAPAASFNLNDLVPVVDDQWSHVWYDVTGVTTSPVTITLSVSDDEAVILDEVSLSSALSGGGWLYLPTVSK